MSAIEAGTPQGSPISPLLANIALHVLDEAWQGGGQRHGVLVKYADDLVVLCATREQAEQARELVAAVLDTRVATAPREDQDRAPRERCRGVRLPRLPSSDAGVVEAAGSLVSAEVAVPAGDGLDQRQDPRPDRPPLRKAAAGMGGRGPQPRDARLGQLLPLRKLRAKFAQIDGYVNERLAILASAKHGLKGRNWTTRFNYEWVDQLGVYRLSGTVNPRLRMPAGERCRRAVCGRTARTVRCGGGRQPRTSRHRPRGPRTPPADPTTGLVAALLLSVPARPKRQSDRPRSCPATRPKIRETRQ